MSEATLTPEPMLVVDPNELRAWRLRLGLDQGQLARLAHMPRERVNILENRLAGQVSSYRKVNRTLRAYERQQQEKIA